MNIELLARQALDKIKGTWGLPEKGFIAGGSIANIVWELVSGNKSIVNDVDVFLFDGVMSESEMIEFTSSGKRLSYVDKDLKYYEDYSGLKFVTTPKEFYSIDSSEKDGIFNYIKYRSSSNDPSIVLNSFDINCTTIGYSIEEDKFYWLKSFEEFLETGNLKVCSLTTPCHTAIRICKKQDELNAKLDSFEYSLLTYAIKDRFIDTNKTKFSTRYSEMYDKYKDRIPFYVIERREEDEIFLRTKGIDIELYTLLVKDHPKNNPNDFDILDNKSTGEKIFNDVNLNRIFSSKHFLFYMRNIYNNEDLKKIWEKVSYFFTTEDYIDVTIVDEKSLERLARLTEHAPGTIESLKGFRLSKQLEFVDNLFEKFKEDPLVGISILEKYKMDDIDLNDDSSLLILELSVRRNVISDKDHKVDRVLNREYSKFDNVDDDLIF